MDKQRPGLSCILNPFSRIGYKPFHASNKGRSHSCSFLGWSARTFPYLTGHISQCRWLLPGVAFSGIGPEMALIRSRVSWCYAYPPQKYNAPCSIGGNRFGARNVGLVRCIRRSVVAKVHLVPRIQSVSLNGGLMVTMGIPREW